MRWRCRGSGSAELGLRLNGSLASRVVAFHLVVMVMVMVAILWRPAEPQCSSTSSFAVVRPSGPTSKLMAGVCSAACSMWRRWCVGGVSLTLIAGGAGVITSRLEIEWTWGTRSYGPVDDLGRDRHATMHGAQPWTHCVRECLKVVSEVV